MMKYIVGNWKMYPVNYEDALMLAKKVKSVAVRARLAKVTPIICPPMPFLAGFAKMSSSIDIGAQNCFTEIEGAHTGETSPAQLASLGMSYVILGHSERRAAGETSSDVAAKIEVAIKQKLSVILCVGEKARDGQGAYFNEIASQLRASLEGFPTTKTSQLIIAYEPVWAIGKNAVRPATPEDFREVEMLLRRELSALFGKTKAFKVPVLYGGSVSKDNAQSFINIGADGLLIGRTSLDGDAFVSIVKSAMRESE